MPFPLSAGLMVIVLFLAKVCVAFFSVGWRLDFLVLWWRFWSSFLAKVKILSWNFWMSTFFGGGGIQLDCVWNGYLRLC